MSGTETILCGNPGASYRAYKAEIDSAIAEVLDRGWYILGEEAAAFEREFAAFAGAEFGIGVGSGTEALHLALRACGIGEGDEVITASHTFVGTVSAIERAGARPIFADIDPVHFTIDPEGVHRAITPRTRAIVPVHLYGHPADIKALVEMARMKGIRVVEDCAQAHGATCDGRRIGSFGDAGCFSFYPTKNLGALGDGGIVVTSDPQIARRARLLREYGCAEPYVSEISGWNTRLDELQAAILRVKLRGLESDNTVRRRLAGRYAQMLDGIGVVTPACRTGCEHVYYVYVIRSRRRESLREFLRDRGIGCLVHYPVPVHLQPAYRNLRFESEALKETERAAREVLSLPVYPQLRDDDQQRVVRAIEEFHETARG